VIDRAVLGLPVLHETPHELVVVKPAGMAVELTSDPHGASLLAHLRRACSPPLDPRLPHRLDRIARGLVLVALTPAAIAFHGEQIRARRWDKTYLARVHVPSERSLASLLGAHQAYLKRVRDHAQIVRSGGKPAFLEILAAHPAPQRPGQAHVLVKLLTGRYHQVRAMLAGLGAPLVDDPLYGIDPPRRWRERDFYLEHVVLRYTDLERHAPCVAFFRTDPDRESLAPAMREEIEARVESLVASGSQ